MDDFGPAYKRLAEPLLIVMVAAGLLLLPPDAGLVALAFATVVGLAFASARLWKHGQP